MPAPLPASATLGALLRLVEQEKTQSTAEQVPGTEPQAPVRAAVTAPLESPLAPESPESSRVVSLKSEGGVAPSGEGAAPTITPTSAKVGPIGGPDYEGPTAGPQPGQVDTSQLTPQQNAELSAGLDIGRALPIVPEPTPSGPPEAPISFAEWQAQSPNNRNFSQYLASTGQQNVLDKVRSTPGAALNEATGTVSGFPGGLDVNVIPQPAGGINFQQIPKPEGQPNNATLSEYLAQGKTAAQWYAETGRQSELNALTKGATQPIPTDVQASLQRGIAPVIGEGGKYTIPTAQQASVSGQAPLQTTEFVGPLQPGETRGQVPLRPQLAPEPAYRPEGFIGPMRPEVSEELMATYAFPTGAPTPTPPAGAAGELMRKLDAAKSDAERDQIVKQFMIQHGLGNYIPQATPTPTPALRR